MYNLFTGANKSSYIDMFIQRNVNAFELSGGVEPEPTRAYVVTDEMTNSQNQLANIRRRATI